MYVDLIENVRQLVQDYLVMTATVLKVGHRDHNPRYEIELKANVETASLIPDIKVTFLSSASMVEITLTAYDIIKDLAETVLSDYTDFQTQISLNEVESTLVIRFLGYNIRKE